MCEEPKGLKKGEIGICIETFIAGPSRGIPKFAADNRTYSSSGGTYKTSDRFIVDPASGVVRDASRGIGRTLIFPGYGIVGHSNGEQIQPGVTSVGAIANARTLSPYPPFNINYSLTINVFQNGAVTVHGSHDGFPSYEVWAYRKGQAPELVYSYREGNFLQLAGTSDVRQP